MLRSLLSNSILKNSLWYTAGNIGYAASSWLIVILITNVLGLDSVGIYALAFAISAPVFMLTNMRLRLVITSDAKAEHANTDYYSLRFITSLTALFIIISYSFVFIDNAHMRWVLLIIAGAKCFESLSDIIYGFFQKNDDLFNVGLSLILKSIVSVIISILIIYKGGNLIHIALGLIVSHVIILLLYDLNAVLLKTELSSPSVLNFFFQRSS